MIRPEYSNHRNQVVVLIPFSYDPKITGALRLAGGALWSRTLCCWYFPEHAFNPGKLMSAMKGMAWIDFTGLRKSESLLRPVEAAKDCTECSPLLSSAAAAGLEAFRSWLQFRRYSNNTISSYMDAARSFLLFIHPKPYHEACNDDMVRYVNDYILKRRLSFSYQNQVVNACKLFFREVVKSGLNVEKLERPRREHRLPNVLSKEEVKALIEAPTNTKHRTMLSLLYACGLRRSELLALKPGNVDSKRGLLIVLNAKGKKDRVVPVSEKIIEMLRGYYKIYRPKVWLFEGQQPGEQYSEASLQKVLKNGLKSAKIKRPVTLHWLRHSYATHLLDGGTDLRFIQELLGHKSSRTTEIYTHVTIKGLKNIKSPFDDF